MSIRAALSRRIPRRAAQRGIVGMVALMFIVIVVFFAMIQASTISASNITDSSRQLDSVEALFLAESAIEHVGHRFAASGTPPVCDAATVGVGEADVALGRGVFRVIGVFTTTFDGAPLASANTCRVRVQAEIPSTKVTRTVDTIVGTEDDLISISSLNPSLNEVPFEGSRSQDEFNPPTAWSVTPSTAGTGSMLFIPWDHLGGNHDTNISAACKTSADSCDRGLFLRKTDTGS